jgi:hypothetical protein
MTLPSQSITVLDPGIGRVTVSSDAPLYLGNTVGGSAVPGTLLSFSRKNAVRAVLGYSELANDVAKALQERGGPVLVMPLVASGDAEIAPVAKSRAGAPTIEIGGTPRDRFSGRIEIMSTGVLGVATFRYSLDAHDPTITPTYSATRIVPAGGSFAAGPSGLTVTFPAGTYDAGDTYTFTTEPALSNADDIGDGIDAMHSLTQVTFPLVILSDTYSDASSGASAAAAMGAHMTDFAGDFRYARAIVDVGSGADPGDVLAESLSWSDRRVCACYGFAIEIAALPYEGFGMRKVSARSSIAARAARELISTDLARFASGSLAGVRKIEFDSFDDPTLDNAGIATLRTWPGIPGYYVGKARLKAPPGSDFTDLHFGRIMDRACRIVYEAQLPFMAEGFRTLSNGAIDPLDAADVETAVNGALFDTLRSPNNARGRKGHVSAVSYKIDPEHNLNTTGQILTSVAIRPLGYANEIVTQIGYSLEV